MNYIYNIYNYIYIMLFKKVREQYQVEILNRLQNHHKNR